ncbi:MAG TPA: hypothetical protein VKB64_04875 [Gaiellaceae bacterium]|nr:hypothetical protein [Gaiellaceae bacterium]
MRWLLGLAIAAAVLVGQVGSAAAKPPATGGDATCNGGSIAPGTYSSLTVAGACFLDSGSVTVTHNVSVQPAAALIAAFGGSDLTVGQNLAVQSNGVLVLGCEPEAFACINDPDQEVGTLITNDRVGGNLTASNALAVLAHHNTIGGNVVLSGGGGGLNCDPQDALFGSPAYATYEDNVIGGNAVVSNWQSCWLGFIRNSVSGNVNYQDNSTFDPDGNEVVTNTIHGGLNCSGNDPAPQFGDSEGNLNVAARATGQCVGLVKG